MIEAQLACLATAFFSVLTASVLVCSVDRSGDPRRNELVEFALKLTFMIGAVAVTAMLGLAVVSLALEGRA